MTVFHRLSIAAIERDTLMLSPLLLTYPMHYESNIITARGNTSH